VTEIEDVTQRLWSAAKNKLKCRITLSGEFLPRLIFPYGVCKTSRNQVVLVCWQEMGFTKAGRTAGYRNLALREIAEVEILDDKFRKRDDFNPLDGQYKEWVFHI
jgi:hypothetical protein